MSAKKWAVSLICFSLVAIALLGTAEFILDPLLCFRGESSGLLTFRHYSELYANPGIAKHYDYDAVLVGSSMVENTNVSEIDQLFDCVTIKVPYSGGSAYNFKAILDICYNTGKRIDKVFWALDEYALTTGVNSPSYPLPEYLYDNNRINDIAYLLNLDIFYFYTLKDLHGTWKGQTQRLMRDGAWISDDSVYCRQNALASIAYPMVGTASKGERYYEPKLSDNLENNILPFLNAHPETEFYFYMVPYSILYWYQSKQNGTLEAEIYNAKIAIGELLQYDNAKVFFFQDDLSIITDLDLYKDYSHFKPEINSFMTQEMKNGCNLLAPETYEQRLDDFYKLLLGFDYDRLIQNNAASD